MGGLVLLVMLIGFTIMQSAFSGAGFGHGAVSDSERKALALTGSGDIIFDWDVDADRIYVSPEIEHQLGLKRGSLEGPAARAGSNCSTASTGSATGPRSIRCWSSVAAASRIFSGCVRPTVTISGTRLKARPVVGPGR